MWNVDWLPFCCGVDYFILNSKFSIATGNHSKVVICNS